MSYEHKTGRLGTIEVAIRTLECLRRETDSAHRIKQTALREVLVECSPFGIVNWAMQYSDRVEVLAPESVREAVKERIRKMNKKYGV